MRAEHTHPRARVSQCQGAARASPAGRRQSHAACRVRAAPRHNSWVAEAMAQSAPAQLPHRHRALGHEQAQARAARPLALALPVTLQLRAPRVLELVLLLGPCAHAVGGTAVWMARSKCTPLRGPPQSNERAQHSTQHTAAHSMRCTPQLPLPFPQHQGSGLSAWSVRSKTLTHRPVAAQQAAPPARSAAPAAPPPRRRASPAARARPPPPPAAQWARAHPPPRLRRRPHSRPPPRPPR